MIAAAPSAVRAQAWSLDPIVAPAIINDSPMLLNATFVAATGGQILAYGDFTHVNGAAVPGIARLGTDGLVDPAFAADLAADERVTALAPLPDGRAVALIATNTVVAVVGPPPVPLTPVVPIDLIVFISPPEPGFVDSPIASITKLIRLRADGRKDTTFSALAIEGYPRLLPLPDGRVLAWGTFRSIGGQACNGLARLNADGTLDASFAPSLASASLNVNAVAAASDGSLVVSAVTYEPQGRARYYFTRLLATGAIDNRFAPATVGTTYSLLAVQPDGSVLAGNGNLSRYTPTGALDPTYTIQIPGLRSVTRIASLPSGRLAIETTVGPPNALGAPAVFTIGINGQLERDFRRVPGSREGHRLLATLADGRLAVVQGTLLLNSSYYPIPFDATAPAESVIAPIFLGPILADPVLALSSADASSLTSLGTTLIHRYSGSVNRLESDSAGRVIAAGTFTHVDGQPRAGLARFLASGALDPTFAPAAGELLFAPPDGRLIVRQTTIGPTAEDGFHRYVTQTARLELDGRLDRTFAFPAKLDAAKTNWLGTMPDGRILIAAFDPDDSREENLKLI